MPRARLKELVRQQGLGTFTENDTSWGVASGTEMPRAWGRQASLRLEASGRGAGRGWGVEGDGVWT